MTQIKLSKDVVDRLQVMVDEIINLCEAMGNGDPETLDEKMLRDVERIRSASTTLKGLLSLQQTNHDLDHHDLRTPTNVIIGYSHTMADFTDLYDFITERQRNTAQQIHATGMSFLKIFYDTIEIKKVTTGPMQLNIQPIVLSELFREVPYTISYVGISEDTILYCDEFRIKQCISRLSGNSSKLDPNLSATVRVERQPKHIAISFVDPSKIINSEHLSVIQDSLNAPLNAINIDNLGLELGIVSGLVTLHGGYTTLTSEIGVGSTFTLHLPTN